MSGIYIKGMEMPKCCYDCELIDIVTSCPLYDIPSEAYCQIDYIRKRRDKDCPLIEVPTPHGDLIDRDALIKDGWLNLYKEVIRMGGYAIHELPLKNPSIPAVIEKENC